ncbi:hypothetical protein CALVIDRAFT_464452, partial [Calocera viscosa TUFC12733]
AIAVTASTGIAARNIGGVTLHSFAGVGLALEQASDIAWRIRNTSEVLKRWQELEVLIIDES